MRPSSGFGFAPMMLYWETTRACGLACRHCRAEAVALRDPRELSTEEGYRLFDMVRGFGEQPPHVVLTGGDPLQRPDLNSLIRYARSLGLLVSITPSGTPSLTRASIEGMKESGATSLAFSIDGSSPLRHDRIRGVDGSFERTLQGVRWAQELGMPIQLNTLVAAETEDDLQAVHQLVLNLNVERWALFFLIGVGRGSVLSEVSPRSAESIIEWVHGCSQVSRPIIKTTEAHHYRRVAAQRSGSEPQATENSESVRRGWGVRDGSGIVFISHTGDVFPSGFLPLRAGNVRDEHLVDIYREGELFRQLRDPSQLKGKCGECEYKVICGGSRARAWAATGDPMESDPLCEYIPGKRQPVAV